MRRIRLVPLALVNSENSSPNSSTSEGFERLQSLVL